MSIRKYEFKINPLNTTKQKIKREGNAFLLGPSALKFCSFFVVKQKNKIDFNHETSDMDFFRLSFYIYSYV